MHVGLDRYISSCACVKRDMSEAPSLLRQASQCLTSRGGNRDERSRSCVSDLRQLALDKLLSTAVRSFSYHHTHTVNTLDRRHERTHNTLV